jgi:hypothetical protein
LGKFWRVLQCKILVYFKTIWPVLLLFEIFYGHSVYYVVIWYIFSVLVFCTWKNLATLLESLPAHTLWPLMTWRWHFFPPKMRPFKNCVFFCNGSNSFAN